MALTALVAFPLMLGLAGTARPFVEVVFGAAWVPIVPLLFILAPVGALQAVGATVGNIYQVTGRTDLLVRWAAAAGVVCVSAFAIGLRWGVVGVAAAYALAMIALTYPLFAIPLNLIGLRISQVADAVKRPLACSLAMLVFVLLSARMLPADLASGARLILLSAAGAAIYATTSWAYNRDTLRQLAVLIQPARARG
jgi:PST family polysaccharide transporter